MAKLREESSTNSTTNRLGKPISIDAEAFTVSLLFLGEALGCLLSGYVSTRIGKKKTLTLFGILMLTAYTLIGLSRTVDYMVAARFILGVGTGCSLVVVPVFVQEICEDHRHLTAGIMETSLTFGILISCLLGPYLIIRDFTFVCFATTAFMMAMFSCFVPETPQDLVAVNDEKCAIKALKKLKSLGDEAAQKELERLKDIAGNDSKTFLDKNKFKANFKECMVLLSLLCFQQLCGFPVIVSYMDGILRDTHEKISSNVCTATVCTVLLYSTLFFSSLVQKIKRRTSLILSASTTCVASVVLGIYFFLLKSSSINSTAGWLPLVSLIVYVTGYSSGLGHLSWTYSHCFLDPRQNTFAISLANSTAKIVAFTLTLLFPYMNKVYGLAYSFWMFSMFSLFGIIFMLIFLPREVEDKTATENNIEITVS